MSTESKREKDQPSTLVAGRGLKSNHGRNRTTVFATARLGEGVQIAFGANSDPEVDFAGRDLEHELNTAAVPKVHTAGTMSV